MAMRPTGPALDEALNGYPVYLGTIDCTTSAKTNAAATTPFANSGNLLKGKVLLIRNAGSVNVLFHPVTTSTGDVATSRGTNYGVTLAPNERVYVTMGQAYGYISAIAASDTANLDFWEMH